MYTIMLYNPSLASVKKDKIEVCDIYNIEVQ